MTQEALKLALDFVETVHVGEWVGSIERQLEVITAIKEALAKERLCRGEASMTQESLKLALEALEDLLDQTEFPLGYAIEQANEAITAIKEALTKEKTLQALHSENERLGLYRDAYVQPEPVAREQFYPDIGKPQIEFAPVKIVAYNCTCGRTMKFESVHGVVAPQRTWVGLTDEERKDIALEVPIKAVLITEAKLKEKNT